MDEERWKRIEILFHGAVACPQGDREAYLREASGGDASLVRDVLSLIDSDGRSPRAIHDAIAREAAHLMTPDASSTWVGRRIGPWRVTRMIGEGGGGAVLQGARDDGRFEQTVAIKVLGLGIDRAEHLARFRHERRLLAQLDHPHIARLLDGGELPGADGAGEVPYIVMEHVEGRSITAHDRDGRASVRERLQVFLQVLGAVAYAHHRLVLHRDLKPDNILVTATGTAKLLDFGVAQFLNDEGSGLNDDGSGSGGHTVRAGMTPEYASPEQLNGAPLTVESDVYSKRGLGLALANQQEFGPAVEKVRHALATFEKLDAADRSDGGSQQDIGVTRSVLGVIALRMGNRPQAEIDLNESVRVLRETLSEHPADVSVRQDLSEAYVALASVRSNSNTCGESATPLAPAETLWRDLARTTPLAAPYAGTQVAALERSHPACRQ